jgi:hypothetical protein
MSILLRSLAGSLLIGVLSVGLLLPKEEVAAQESKPIYLYTGQGSQKNYQWVDAPEEATAYVFRETVPEGKLTGRVLVTAANGTSFADATNHLVDITSLQLDRIPGGGRKAVRTTNEYPSAKNGQLLRYLLLIRANHEIYSTRTVRSRGGNYPRFYTLDGDVYEARVGIPHSTWSSPAEQILDQKTTAQIAERDRKTRGEVGIEASQSAWRSVFMSVLMFVGSVVVALYLIVKLADLYLTDESIDSDPEPTVLSADVTGKSATKSANDQAGSSRSTSSNENVAASLDQVTVDTSSDWSTQPGDPSIPTGGERSQVSAESAMVREPAAEHEPVDKEPSLQDSEAGNNQVPPQDDTDSIRDKEEEASLPRQEMRETGSPQDLRRARHSIGRAFLEWLQSETEKLRSTAGRFEWYLRRDGEEDEVTVTSWVRKGGSNLRKSNQEDATHWIVDLDDVTLLLPIANGSQFQSLAGFDGEAGPDEADTVVPAIVEIRSGTDAVIERMGRVYG